MTSNEMSHRSGRGKRERTKLYSKVCFPTSQLTPSHPQYTRRYNPEPLPYLTRDEAYKTISRPVTPRSAQATLYSSHARQVPVGVSDPETTQLALPDSTRTPPNTPNAAPQAMGVSGTSRAVQEPVTANDPVTRQRTPPRSIHNPTHAPNATPQVMEVPETSQTQHSSRPSRQGQRRDYRWMTAEERRERRKESRWNYYSRNKDSILLRLRAGRAEARRDGVMVKCEEDQAKHGPAGGRDSPPPPSKRGRSGKH